MAGARHGPRRRSALLDSPLGWAGQRTLATLWFAAGEAIAAARREALLDAARAACDAHPLGRHAGATAVDPGVIVVRVLAPRVEPAMELLARDLARLAAARLAARGLAAARLAHLSAAPAPGDGTYDPSAPALAPDLLPRYPARPRARPDRKERLRWT